MTHALAITGPTASGKTALSIDLAREFEMEIISCDSMQIYRGMDIGTAKATVTERAAVPHHLIDFLSPLECYSAEAYRTDAMAAVRDITKRGKLPLFVGGTGLYIDTLMRAAAVGSPPSDLKLREELLSKYTADELYERLKLVDPESAATTHENNVKRVVRALEIYELTGKTKSYFDALSRTVSPDIEIGMITLDFHNRENLYKRVDKRVDGMLADGLLSEVEGLWGQGMLKDGTTAASAIGYKEIIEYLENRTTLPLAIEQIKLSSRRYAKRQLTWFRHERDAVRIYVDTEDGQIKPYGEIIAEATLRAKELTEKIKTNR